MLLSNELKRYIVEEEFPAIQEYAKANQTCKRKAVGCSVLEIWNEPVRPGILSESITRPILVHNGPSGDGHECSDQVGNCGCSHAEPRACIAVMCDEPRLREVRDNAQMVCTYSPCTNCANIIVDSGVIDAVVYDILTEHDRRGVLILKRAMPVFNREDLCTS